MFPEMGRRLPENLPQIGDKTITRNPSGTGYTVRLTSPAQAALARGGGALQRGAYCGERGVSTGADRLDRSQANNYDQREHHGVFHRGRAVFRFQETTYFQSQLGHGAPQQRRTPYEAEYASKTMEIIREPSSEPPRPREDATQGPDKTILTLLTASLHDTVLRARGITTYCSHPFGNRLPELLPALGFATRPYDRRAFSRM